MKTPSPNDCHDLWDRRARGLFFATPVLFALFLLMREFAPGHWHDLGNTLGLLSGLCLIGAIVCFVLAPRQKDRDGSHEAYAYGDEGEGLEIETYCDLKDGPGKALGHCGFGGESGGGGVGGGGAGGGD